MKILDEVALLFAVFLLMFCTVLMCLGCLGVPFQKPSNPQAIVDAQWVKVAPPDPSLRCWQMMYRGDTVICDRIPTEEAAPIPAISSLQKEVPVERSK